MDLRRGTLCAAGVVHSGHKRIVAVDCRDNVRALKLVGFTTFGKPGGSDFARNRPLSEADLQLWRAHGVRFGVFDLRPGDAYMIPAGMPHEFQNLAPSLSMAWNFMPLTKEGPQVRLVT